MKNKNMVKQLLISAVIAGVAILGINMTSPSSTDIVEENGFMVLEDKDDKTSTIVAVVGDTDKDGDGYIFAQNVYDNRDEVAFEKDGFNKGDVVLVTFENDDIINVEKNDLNIGDIVKGQNVKK